MELTAQNVIGTASTSNPIIHKIVRFEFPSWASFFSLIFWLCVTAAPYFAKPLEVLKMCRLLAGAVDHRLTCGRDLKEPQAAYDRLSYEKAQSCLVREVYR